MIWPIRIIDYKKNCWIEYIFNSVNFHDLNIYLNRSSMKMLPFTYLYLLIFKLRLLNYFFNMFSSLIWQKWKMLNWFQCQFGISKGSVIWSSKIWLFELFNYFISCDTKMLSLDNQIGFLIQLFELILQKWIELKKVSLAQKLNYWNIL